MEEKVFYASDPHFIDILYINDVLVPEEVRMMIRMGDAYILRKSNDTPARYVFFNSTGGMWRWRHTDKHLVELL